MGLDHSKVKSYVHNSLNKQERFNIDSIRNFQLNKTIEPWKLNLLDISPDGKKIFFASNKELLSIDVSSLLEDQNPLPLLIYKYDHPNDSINQLRCLKIDDLWCLATTSISGYTYIHFLGDLSLAPIKLRNSDQSWSLSSSPNLPYIAVGANTHDIKIYNLNTSNPNTTFWTLSGHAHNIPCVDISPCGGYIATISIDKTFRIWNIETQELIIEGDLPYQWGWGVKWIRKDSILNYCEYNNVDYILDILNGDEHLDNTHLHVIKSIEENSLALEYENLSEVSEDIADELVAFGEIDSESEEWDSDDDFEEVIENEDFEILTTSNAQIFNFGEEERLKKSTHNCPHGPFIRDVNTQNKKEQLSEYLILCSTFDSLLLYDTDGKQLANLSNVFRPMSSNFSIIGMARLAINYYIPEISTILTASQGSCTLFIVTLRKNLVTNQYEFIPELGLPHRVDTLSPIVGVTYHKLDEVLNNYRIYILLQNGKLFIYDLSFHENTNGYNPETVEIN